MRRFIILVLFVLMATPVLADDLSKALENFYRAKSSFDKIDDYTCTFHKKENVGGEIIISKSDLKFKKPFCVYYKEFSGFNKDIACAYIEGKNDNRLATRNTGFLGLMTVNIDPTGSIAMKGNRHPITHIGLGYILSCASKDIHSAMKNKDAVFTYEGDCDVYGRKAVRVRTEYPKDKGYYAHKVILSYDKETGLPLKITMFDWDNKFMEEYGYENLKTNVGLTEKDFSI